MKAGFLFVSILIQSVLVNAQMRPLDDRQLVNHAYDTADQLRNEVRYLPESAKDDISKLLTQIDDVILGGGNGRNELRCVSRDGDGFNPWMLAVRDGVNDKRIPGTVIGSEMECNKVKNSISRKGRQTLACVSRDNDGHNPFLVGTIDTIEATFSDLNRNLVYANFTACQTAVQDARDSRDGAIFCSSRDKDGNNPFVQVLLKYNGEIQRGSETYTSYTECMKRM